MKKPIVTVELFEDEGVQKINWTAAQGDIEVLDQLIDALGKWRLTLAPEVSRERPAEGSQVVIVGDPAWFAAPDLTRAPVLSLRHGGFGWVNFRFPLKTVDPLVLQLQKLQQLRDGPKP